MGHFEGDPSGTTHATPWVEDEPPQILAAFALRMVVERVGFRIDAMNERGLPGVSISNGFATEIVGACKRAAQLLDPEPAQAGLIAGGGSSNANVSGGVTGGGERAVGDAAGETGGHMELPPIGDPAVRPSHDDLCRLSRAFNEVARLDNPQDCRINDWLKRMIAREPD